MLRLFKMLGLIDHEWVKCGSCGGTGSKDGGTCGNCGGQGGWDIPNPLS